MKQRITGYLSTICLTLLFSVLTACSGGGGGGGGGGGPTPSSTPISATPNTTAQHLTVGTAMASFSPLTPSDGTPPYIYSFSGTLPTGLSFNSSTGVVTGTPTATYATANLVFSVQDANTVVANTTSTVSFTVVAAPTNGGGGTGVTFSQAVGGRNSVADVYFNGVNNTGGFTSAVTGGEIIQWYNSDHAAAVLNYESARNFIAINFNAASYIMCGISGPVDNFPDCASIKVTLDRAGGTITFASSPMLDLSFIATGITASGSLSFTPF